MAAYWGIAAHSAYDMLAWYNVIGRFLQSYITIMVFVIKASATAVRAHGPSVKMLLSQCPITLFHLKMPIPISDVKYTLVNIVYVVYRYVGSTYIETLCWVTVGRYVTHTAIHIYITLDIHCRVVFHNSETHFIIILLAFTSIKYIV